MRFKQVLELGNALLQGVPDSMVGGNACAGINSLEGGQGKGLAGHRKVENFLGEGTPHVQVCQDGELIMGSCPVAPREWGLAGLYPEL